MIRAFAGNTLASFSRNSTAIKDGDTTAGSFDPIFVSSSIMVPAPFFIETAKFSTGALTTSWTHNEIYVNSAAVYNANVDLLQEWINSSGIAVLRLVCNYFTARFMHWNGSAWVESGGGSFRPAYAGRARYDVKVVCGIGGSIDLYSAGTLVLSVIAVPGSSLDAAVNNVQSVRFYGGYNSANVLAYYSQIMISDSDTRDARYQQTLITGDDISTGGTGSYTDINEYVLDEKTAVSFGSAGLSKNFTKAAVSLPAGYKIGALCISARSRNSGSVADVVHNVRSGGTTYVSTGVGAVGGYEPRCRTWGTDPASGLPWTSTTYNAATPGGGTI